MQDRGRFFVLYTNNYLNIPSYCDAVSIKPSSPEELKSILPLIDKPLMICGSGKDEIDAKLLPDFINVLDRECIISFATEKNYKSIVPSVINGGHQLVLKTPIDINLAKELNILVLEMGPTRDKIIMNTDIGGLGYGYEYGYSMIEKIKLEKNDEYLSFPIITEASTEALKTKEATSSEKMAKMYELTSVSGAIAAGADIFIVHYPENIKILKGLV